MKIRTRLLLFLLPTVICSIALVSTLLSFKWYQEIVEGFQTRLKSAVITTAALSPSQLQLEKMRDELQVTNLYIAPLDSPALEMIPKKLHITPIYKTERGENVMTGYAPIFDEKGHISSLMAADIDVSLIDKKFHESLYLILLCAGLTIVTVATTLFVIANKISRPVAKLNNSALAIAAGQYGESIPLQGPREIAELANTLNTMSECLHENINRLKENSFLRERMYGEYESALLLQHMMLQKNIDDCRSDAVAVKPISFFSETPRGLLLDFPKQATPERFEIHIAEAEEAGFEGMYQLLTQYKFRKEAAALEIETILKKDAKSTSLSLNRHTGMLSFQGPHTPIFWSLDRAIFLVPHENQLNLESGDYLFLFNEGLMQFFKKEKSIQDLVSKVLKIFATDGLETCATMLQKELLFATKRKDLEEDIHLLCFQILTEN